MHNHNNNQTYSTTQTGSQITAQFINKIFMALAALKPAYKQSAPHPQEQEVYFNEYKRQLLRALSENEINEWSMIERGLKCARAKNTPWLPPVAEFIEDCKPKAEDFGLKSNLQAFQEARIQAGINPDNRQWSHGAVYRAAKCVGFYDLKGVNDNNKELLLSIKQRFEAHYMDCVEMVMNGEWIEVPDSHRIAPIKVNKKEPRNVAAADSTILRMRGMFDEDDS